MRQLRLIIVMIFVLAFLVGDTFAQVRIHEFSASNRDSIADDDGDYPDWVELINRGPDPVSLDGWFLTDDANDLQKWRFPAVSIDPGSYRIVFASGKDRTDPSGELHTNFALSTEGEYLALVAPGGERIEDEFAPTYPSQEGWNSDLSYGAQTQTQFFLDPSTPTRWSVAADGSSGLDWTQLDFDDSSWESGQPPIGFGESSGQFQITLVRSREDITSLAEAEEALTTPTLQLSKTQDQNLYINFNDNASDENYEDSDRFPGHEFGDDVDNFVMLATATVLVPHDGDWTFGINSDDGARLRINGNDVIVDDALHAPRDTLGRVRLEAGNHEIELLYFEHGGGASVELFAAFGTHTSFSPTSFRLVGESWANGVIHTGFRELIETDIADEMFLTNASMQMRTPFFVDDVISSGILEFDIFYSDGFVAWLNGNEIARRNAPDSVQWNSSATLSRTISEVLQPETIRIPVSEDLLLPGENVLAVQGLNSSANDGDFMLVYRMSFVDPESDSYAYFTNPTPGAANGAGLQGRVAPVLISRDAGFYEDDMTVTLSHTTPGVIFRYTTDGSDPTEENGEVYSEPLSITTTTTLRARGFLTGWEPSASQTRSYIYLNDVIRQTRPPNFPTRWGGNQNADYAMDPDVVNHSDYRDTIIDDMKSIPTMSLVMNADDWFDSRNGIYTNTERKGLRWERPGSVELIFPDGREGFQVNAGLRMQGGYSRTPGTRKHSFRMIFRNSYGPGRLEFPLFEESDVTVFDTLVLRAGYNYTWHSSEGGFGSNIGKADYMRDEFSRRTQLAMGQPSAYGTYVHVYLNGTYWGLYNLHERPDEAFSSDHLGGGKDDWDVVTGGTRGTSSTRVKSGDKDAYNEMISVASRANVNRPDVLEEIEELVNIDGLIDYMLAVYFTGNRDAPTVIGGSGTPWNFYSSKRRLPGYGYRFYLWDSEWSLEDTNRNVIEFHNGRDNPAMVFQRLRTYPEFRLRVADRIQKHFFNDGALTVEAAQQRYQEIASIIDRAIVGESARWGDLKHSSPRMRSPHWTNERDRILNTYLSRRTGIVLNQLRNANLYPELVAPQYNQHGGLVDSGFGLEIRSAASSSSTTTLVDYDSVWNYEQSGQALPSSWRSITFADSSWPRGRGLLYVESSLLPQPKRTELTLGQSAYYFRSSFSLTQEQLDSAEQFYFSTIVDDGAVIYLNGAEVIRFGMPDGPISHGTFASRTVSNAAEEGPFVVPRSAFRVGENVIAVEVHQTNIGSSDIVFGLKLETETTTSVDTQIPVYFTTDGSDPRMPGGEIAESAVLFETPVAIEESQRVRSRTFDGTNWSAMTDATFEVEPSATRIDQLRAHLRVSELMYDPAVDQVFEFVELHNTHPTETLSLANVAFTDGITYAFPAEAQIPPQGYLLVTSAQNVFDQGRFEMEYGIDSSVPMFGPYEGRLANGGETLELRDVGSDERILSFEYNDNRGWPLPADGSGHSLVPIEQWYDNQPEGGLDYGSAWRASGAMKGSPGSGDPSLSWALRLSEVYASSNGESGYIETERLSSIDPSAGEWFISTDKNTPFQVSLTSILQSQEAITTQEVPLVPEGGDVLLSYRSHDQAEQSVVDWVRYTAQGGETSVGRMGESAYWLQRVAPSKDGTNDVGEMPLVISEVMYHSVAEDSLILSASAYEYIEVWNSSEEERSLFNESGTFRIDGGVSYRFDSDITLAPQERIVVVSFDPQDNAQRQAFIDVYGDHGARLFGPFSGRLANRTEQIQLEQPVVLGGEGYWSLIDEVIYNDSDPWPTEADGEGFSLHRLAAVTPGNDPASWVAKEANPGEREDTVSVLDWSMY